MSRATQFLNKCRRNLVNILLYVAEQCRRYYPVDEIPNMLETFLPILTKDVCLYLLIIPPLISYFLRHC